MNSGGYSYVYLQKSNGEKLWIAVAETKITSGAQMSFKEGLVMTNFESKTLKKTFDKIIFSNGIIEQPKATPVMQPKAVTAPPSSAKVDDQSIPHGPMLGSKGAVSAKKKISVAKAFGANSYTIEEIYRKSASLDKKNVIVRGKIVKITTGIMKRTWIHIQDGTGSQAKGTHNLVCTTKDTANVGDVVTVKGKLAKDKNFGAGYKYRVIIEDAAVSK